MTVYAFDWEPSASVPSWLSAQSGNPFGLWVTACTTDSKLPSKAIVTFRLDGKEVTRIGKFSTPPYGCASVMIPDVKRADVVGLLVVTSGMDIGNMN